MQENETALAQIREAIDFIGQIPGYRAISTILGTLLADGKVRYSATLSDRAVTDWRGHITVGPEPLQGGIVGLAETLVHEQFHRTQPVYTKTLSFWGGIATGTPVWRQLEVPAYRFAHEFLIAVEQHATALGRLDWVAEARSEQFAVRQTFQTFYGSSLFSEDTP